MKLVFMLVTMLSACGEIVPHDQPQPDAPAIPDSDPRTVRVTLHLNHQPILGAKAYFIDTQGGVAAELLTDANGQASAIVPAGSSVTLVYTTTSLKSIYTVLAVEPGDDLLIGDASSAAAFSCPACGFNLTITPPRANALIYTTKGRCGDGIHAGSSSVIGTSIMCPGPADLFALAYGSGNTLLGYAKFPALTYMDGVDQSVSATWLPPDTIAVALQDVPPDVTAVNLSLRSSDDEAMFFATDGTDLAASSPVTTMNVVHPLMGNRVTFETLVTRSAEVGHQKLIDPIAPPSSHNYGTTLSTLLPWVGTPVVDSKGLVTWTEIAGNHEPTAIYGTVGFQNSPSDQYQWEVVAPRDGAHFQLPALPASSGVPAAIPPTAYAGAVLVDLGGSYHDARQRLSADFKRYGYGLDQRVTLSGL